MLPRASILFETGTDDDDDDDEDEESEECSVVESVEASVMHTTTVVVEGCSCPPEENDNPEKEEKDKRFRLTEGLLIDEKEFLVALRGVEDIYGKPLKKLSSLSIEEHRSLFGGTIPICSLSAMIINKLEDALRSWDPGETRIGPLFSKNFWTQYEDYKEFYSKAKHLLREKQREDEEFVEFCKLRRGAAKHTLDTLLDLPVQRLSQYEKYFQDLLKETRAEHPDHDDIARQAQKAKQLVRRTEGGPETDLDRIQDLFPQDTLYLHEKDPSNMKVKGLMRKRSVGVGAAARLQRALSTKALPGTSTVTSPSTNAALPGMHVTPPSPAQTAGAIKRHFVMEAAVQFTTGVQSQDRHLFLFNDLLLVAKSRSGGNFKLKDRVLICEMWLGATNEAIDEVTELTRSRDTSFVIGWPTTNVVATFNTAATKELWFTKLHEVIAVGKEREPPTTTVQITYYDALNRIEYCKTLSVTPTDTSRDCIRAALEHLEMGTIDASLFQLWVRTGQEDSPYPLIGHEYPFAIKMNCLRDYLASCDNENVDLTAVSNMMDSSCNYYSCDQSSRCQFILRNLRKDSLYSVDTKKAKKSVNSTSHKSPIRIHKMFRRSLTKLDSTDGASPPSVMTPFPGGLLFGQPLPKLCETETVPRPVMEMLLQLFLKGPYTHGIFRKSANARQVRELREQLDTNPDGIDWEQVPILTVSALLKDFLRSLPDCLLGSTLFHEWLAVSQVSNAKDKIPLIQGLFSKLPKENVTLLQHFLCVLHHIARRSGHNQMSASNLAVCVGPSLLWPANATLANGSPLAGSGNAVAAALAMGPETSRLVPSLVELMIERCADLFGHETLQLFGEAPPPASRQDSGAEESDSLHSGQGDSLERDLLGEEPSPLPRKDKMSLTNLSRDSGLTMSDTQLYTPDEEENESTSSGHSGGEKSTYSSGHGSEKSGSEPIRYHHPPGNPSALYASVTRKPSRQPSQRQTPPTTQPPAAPGPSSTGAVDQAPPPSSDYATPHLNLHHHKLTVSYSTPNCDTPDDDGGSGATAAYYEDAKSSAYNNPYFQRTDWTRKHAGLRKVGRAEQGLLPSRQSPLRRSASEESLLDKLRAESPSKRPALHRKGRAPPPPANESNKVGGGGVTPRFSPHIALQHRIVIENTTSPMHRSRSAHHLGADEEIESARVAATSLSGHMDSSQGSLRRLHQDSCDSSTLSDDDSTPHVSRSNSRGKEFTSCGSGPPHLNGGGGGAGGGNNGFDGIYASINSPRSASLPKQEVNINRTGSTSTVKSTDSSSTLTNGSVCSNSSTCRPPSYEETLNRRTARMNSPAKSGDPSARAQGQQTPNKRSSKAEQLYHESWRIQPEDSPHNDFVYACAARVETQYDENNMPMAAGVGGPPPPLPPKQKLARRPEEPIYAPVPLARRKAQASSASPSRGPMTKRHSVETQTEVLPGAAAGGGAAAAGKAGFAPRRHSETPTRAFMSSGAASKTNEKFISSVRIGESPPAPFAQDLKKRRSGPATPTMQDDPFRGRIKRKEASVGTAPGTPSSTPPQQQQHQQQQQQQQAYAARKSASGVRAVLNARAAAASAQANPNSSRSKSLPPPSDERQSNRFYRDSSDTEPGDTSTSELDERSWTVDSDSSDYVDPSLRKEISWSVSQLRALFGGANPAPGEWRGGGVPPPYRHPPASRSYYEGKGAHKTASSDSGWSTSSPRHNRSDSPSSSSNGEESYV